MMAPAGGAGNPWRRSGFQLKGASGSGDRSDVLLWLPNCRDRMAAGATLAQCIRMVAVNIMDLLLNILLGFVGGLILNVMPCVLPVLTMKVFHLVEHSSAGDGSTDRTRRLHGLAYTGGILIAFLALAAAVIALKASGDRVGWGMQFQNPRFVAGMVTLVFVFGLNALGVFEWTLSLSGRPGHQGYGASLVNGLFAAIMSTPCSAPFLGTAAAYALGVGTPWYSTLAMFTSIGIGLASPFLLVSFVPAVGRLLPRPGPWMETFKMLMGFSLVGAAVWLMRAFFAQVARDAAADFLIFLLMVSIALWGIHHFGGVLYSTVRRYAVRAVAMALMLASGHYFLHFEPAAAEAASSDCAPTDTVCRNHIVWSPFDTARVTREHKAGRAVFMDFTAEWCANCKTNEKVFIETDSVRKALVSSGVLPMKADMTNENDEMQGWLDKLGRSGIPAYVIYLPDGSRDLLPEAITSEMLVQHLTDAAKKFPPKAPAAQTAAN